MPQLLAGQFSHRENCQSALHLETLVSRSSTEGTSQVTVPSVLLVPRGAL